MTLESSPVDFKIDVLTGEIIFTDDLQFSNGLEAVAQNLTLALSMFVGEWFLNLDAGVDYYGKVLGQKFNEIRIREEFRRVIIKVQGVDKITSLIASFSTTIRELTVTWKVKTVFSDTPITGSLTQEI